jgi:chaperonin GroEL
VEAIQGNIGGHIGFDAKTCELVNMWEAGIVDPAMVTKNSLRSALSVAGTVLTAEVITTKKA